MSFTRKKIGVSTKSMGFIKGATLFFLGMSCVLFAVKAFEVVPIAPNAIQYIKTIFLTQRGSNVSNTGIILEGSGGHGWFQGSLTVDSLPNVKVLGTDGSGTLIISSASNVFNYISGYIDDKFVNSISFNSGTKLLTLNVSGYGIVTGFIDISGSNSGIEIDPVFNIHSGDYVKISMTGNRNAAYNRIINNSGDALKDIHATGMSFNSGTKILTLYMSGIGNITGLIDLSGAGGSSLDTNNYATGMYFDTSTETLYLYRTGMSVLTASFAGVYGPSAQGEDIYTTGIDFNTGNDVLTLYRSGLNTITGYIPNYWSRNATSGYLYPKTIGDRVGINTTDPQVTLDVNGWFGVQFGQHINTILNAVDRPYDSNSIVTEKGIYDRIALTYKGTKFFKGLTSIGMGLRLGRFSNNGAVNRGRNFLLNVYVSDTVCGDQLNISKLYNTYYNSLISPGGLYTKLIPFTEFKDYRSVCINDQFFVSKVEKVNSTTTRYRKLNPTGFAMGSVGENIMIRGSSDVHNDGYFTISAVDPSVMKAWIEVDNSAGVSANLYGEMKKLGDIFKPMKVASITNEGGDTRRYVFESAIDTIVATGDSVEILNSANTTNDKSSSILRGRNITAVDPGYTWVEINNPDGVAELNSPAVAIFKKQQDVTLWMTSNEEIIAVPSNKINFFASYLVSDYTEQGSEFWIDSCASGIDITCPNAYAGIVQAGNQLIGSNNPTNSIQQQFHYDTSVGIALPITNFLGGIKNNIRTIGYSCVWSGNDESCPIFANDYTVLTSGFVGGMLYLDLPTAIGRKGQTFIIKASTLGDGITINNFETETIDDVQDFVFSAAYQNITLQSDGSNRWRIN